MAEKALSDHDFLEQLTAITEANISNENFGVSQLAAEMKLSRSYIHRRLKKLNNNSVSYFIRAIRLKRALELLYKDNTTVSEITYKVGFGSPSYFSTCFHEYFGFLPSEAKKNESKLIRSTDHSTFTRETEKYTWIKNHLELTIIVVGILLFLLFVYAMHQDMIMQ